MVLLFLSFQTEWCPCREKNHQPRFGHLLCIIFLNYENTPKIYYINVLDKILCKILKLFFFIKWSIEWYSLFQNIYLSYYTIDQRGAYRYLPGYARHMEKGIYKKGKWWKMKRVYWHHLIPTLTCHCYRQMRKQIIRGKTYIFTPA